MKFKHPLRLAIHPFGTGIGAFAANLGAMLAMFMVVFGAFFSAFPADLNTFFHYVFGVGRIPGYELSRQHADIGAIAVQLNAGHHHFYVIFLQAKRGAGFAGGYALYQDVLQVIGLFRFHGFMAW